MAYKSGDFGLGKIVRRRKEVIGPLLFIVISFSLGIYLLFSTGASSANKKLASAEKKNSQSNNAILFLDPDEDGLKNWEEEIYGTNPNNPDSDNDGESDWAEVVSSNTNQDGNPNVYGKDSYDPSKNLTALLLSDFLEKGGVAAITKGEEGEQYLAGILSEKIDALSKNGALPRPLASAPLETFPIQTSDDISQKAIETYLTHVAEIFSKNTKGLAKDNLELFIEIFQSENLDRLSELTPYGIAAEKTYEELSRLKVPKNLSWYHERELFLMREMANHIHIFERAGEDPLHALAIVEKNVETKEEFFLLNRDDLSKWLVEQKIILNPRSIAYRIIR